jgi:hypothetical protein
MQIPLEDNLENKEEEKIDLPSMNRLNQTEPAIFSW